LGLIPAGLAGVALLAWLLRGSGEADGEGDVLAGRSGELATGLKLAPGEGGLPAALTAEAGADGDAIPAPPAMPGLEPEPEPTRALHGTVVMDDGSALPLGLAVFAADTRPPPLVFTMRDLMGGDTDFGDIFDRVTGDPLANAAAGPAPVAPDGRFELQVPLRALWLGVAGEAVYPREPCAVSAGSADEVQLVLERGGSLAGRVLDPEGEPVADAEVVAATPFDPYGVLDRSARMAGLGSRRTDGTGRFTFSQVPAGLGLQVQARAEVGAGEAQFQPAGTDVAPLAVGEAREIELLLQPAGCVSGVVVLPDGSPVAGARVYLRPTSFSLKNISLGDEESFGQEERTGDDGRFAFANVRDGSYEAALAAGRFRIARAAGLKVTPGAVIDDVRLVAEPGLTVGGRVLDTAGQPLEGVSVRGSPPPSLLSFGANFDQMLYPEGSSAADGSFQLTGYEPGKVRLGFHDKDHAALTLDVEAGRLDVEARLQARATLSGIVVSLVDGEPVTDFTLSARPSEGLFKPGDWFGAEAGGGFLRVIRPRHFTDREDGTFTLDGIVPGSYEFSVSAAGFGERLEKGVEVPEGGRRGLVLMLEPECAVVGRVVDARTGQPVPGAIVRSGTGASISDMLESMASPGPTARTDAQGAFRFGGLAAGALRLSIEHASYRALGVAELQLQPGETRDLGRLLLSAGASVYGTVRDELGAAPNVQIMVSNATGSVLKRTRTDGAGQYRVEGLPAGSYNVMRMDFQMDIGQDSSPMDIMNDLVYEAVTLAEDESRRVDLSIGTGGGSRLVGTVRDAAGPVGGAMVALTPESPGGKPGFATTDAEGRYEIGRIQPGRYGVSVMPIDALAGQGGGQPGSPVFASLTLGSLPEQRHDVTLPGGVLNGRVVSAEDGHGVAGARVVLERTDDGIREVEWLVAMGGRVGETYADEAGGFRFRHLPGGEYAVVAGGKGMLGAGASGWARTRVGDLTVVEGSPGFTVRVEVERAAVVAGTVLDARGVPVSGTGVWVLEGGVPRSPFSEVVSDASGGYEVGDLADGAWTLAFMDGSHALTLVRDVVVRDGQRTQRDVRLPDGVAVRVDLAGRPAGSLDVLLSGPEGVLPVRLSSLSDLVSLPQTAGMLSVGTYAPGTYHVKVMAGGETLLDEGVTLVGGSGPKLLKLPPP
jgi:uncharacterized GH25 family protein